MPPATPRKTAPAKTVATRVGQKPEIVVITGLSGSGKGSVLKALEDLGFYSVDNLPVELIPKFAELTRDNPSIQAAALVVDVREGASLKLFPKVRFELRNEILGRHEFVNPRPGSYNSARGVLYPEWRWPPETRTSPS